MIARVDKATITFNQFIEWYPDTSGSCHELRRGVMVSSSKNLGKHSVSAWENSTIKLKTSAHCDFVR
jgi:hypothetical protein